MSAPETYVQKCPNCTGAAGDHDAGGPQTLPAPQPPAPPPDARLAEIRALIARFERAVHGLNEVGAKWPGSPEHAEYLAATAALLARVESDAATIAALRGDAERLDWMEM